MPIILSLYFSPRTHAVYSCIAVNTEPNDLVSILFCFLLIQYMGALFKYIKKSDSDFLIIESVAWSVSAYALIMKPRPRDSGMFGGKVPFNLRSISDVDQFFLSNDRLSIWGTDGSNTILALWYLFKYLNIRYTSLKCSILGRAKCDDIVEILQQMSNLPNSIIHRSTPINDW